MPFNSNPFRIPVQLFHIYFVNSWYLLFLAICLPGLSHSRPLSVRTQIIFTQNPPPALLLFLQPDHGSFSMIIVLTRFFTWVEWGGLAASQELCVRQSSAGDLNNRKISGFRGGCHYTLQLQTFECVNKWFKIIFSDLISKQTVQHLNKMLGQNKFLVIKQPVRIRVS